MRCVISMAIESFGSDIRSMSIDGVGSKVCDILKHPAMAFIAGQISTPKRVEGV